MFVCFLQKKLCSKIWIEEPYEDSAKYEFEELIGSRSQTNLKLFQTSDFLSVKWGNTL